MRALQHGAGAPGFATPVAADHPAHKDETPRLAGAEGFKGQVTTNTPNCGGADLAGQVQQADPDELAFMLAALYVAAVERLSRLIFRAIGGDV